MKRFLLALLFVSTMVQANDKFYNQLKWVQWSIEQEEQTPTEVVKTFLNNFNAYAYKEGDSCLVLGYQGSFTKGVCRLNASAVDKNKCAKNYYPCQPLLFGEGICIKNNSKRLTHQCAVESLKKITAKIKETENLLEFKKSLLSSGFDITKLAPTDFPPEVQAAWPETMDKEKLSQRQQYIGQLCQAVKQGKATGHQVQDLKDCEALHSLASSLVKREEDKPAIVDKKEKDEKQKREVADEGGHSKANPKKDCDKCEVQINKEEPAVADLSKMVEKIKQKANLLPEELSTPIDFKKDLPDDFCDIQEKRVNDYRYLNTKDYKDERFAKPENRMLSVDLMKNEAGVEEAHGFAFEAHTMGTIVDTIDKGEKVEVYEPTVPHRDWSAEFAGRSHQSTIMVTDWPVLEDKDQKTKAVKDRYSSTNITMTRFSFFPRKVTPAMSQVDGEMLMTLPTGETINFDAKTRRVKGGAFKETKRADGGKNPSFTSKNGDLRTYYKPDSDLAYEGKGVWIETKVTSQKDELEGGMITIRTGSPTCKGAGCSSCQVPAKDVYEKKKGFHVPGDQKTYWSCEWVKFKTDEEFDKYLKSKCKFSLPSL